MKKITVFLFALTMILTLCACGTQTLTPTANPVPTSTPSPIPKQLELDNNMISDMDWSTSFIQMELNRVFSTQVTKVEFLEDELFDSYTYIRYYLVTINNPQTYTKEDVNIRVVFTAYEDVEHKTSRGFLIKDAWYAGKDRIL